MRCLDKSLVCDGANSCTRLCMLVTWPCFSQPEYRESKRCIINICIFRQFTGNSKKWEPQTYLQSCLILLHLHLTFRSHHGSGNGDGKLSCGTQGHLISIMGGNKINKRNGLIVLITSYVHVAKIIKNLRKKNKCVSGHLFFFKQHTNFWEF